MSTNSWGIFDQWRKGLLGFSNPNEDGRDDLTTAGGGGGNEQTLQRTYKRGQFPPTDPKYIRDQKRITTPRGRVVKQEVHNYLHLIFKQDFLVVIKLKKLKH